MEIPTTSLDRLLSIRLAIQFGYALDELGPIDSIADTRRLGFVVPPSRVADSNRKRFPIGGSDFASESADAYEQVI
jgi:hypothetical protein